ncbi:MAG TPA: hypothetical protein VFL99_07455, partial [Segeticoccus sp.]|uniref:hypothetical protein n=1 Tax=Segeticoccus sp. TaxID=2706531 RepID=UPI002D7E352B
MSTTPTATTSRRRPRDLRRTWRWGLALLAPLPMLAVAAEAVFVPYGEFATAREQLTAGAAAPGRLTLALWMGFLGVLLAVPATMAVAWTVRRAAPRLALAGGLSCLVGFGMTWAIPNTDQVVRVAAEGGYDVTRVASVIDLAAGHPSANVAVGIFLVGQLIGLVLLGCALWRTPGAPRWAAVALAVSGPLHVAVAGFPVAAAGSWVLTALGYAGASVALVRSRDEDFDLPPA